MSRGGLVAAGVVLAAWIGATSAGATVYSVSVTGTITSQMACSPDPLNTCVDANLAVGDHLTFSARFDSSLVVPWGSYGYNQAGLYGLPTSGARYWSVSGPGGLVWASGDDEFDGSAPFYTSDTTNLADPGVIFSATSVLGLSGYMVPVPTADRPAPPPVLIMGSQTGSGYSYTADGVTNSDFSPATLSDAFQIQPGEGFFGNVYNSPGFGGVWDFAGATMTAIPEPAAWAMMLVGLGGLGAALRGARRERLAAAD